MWYICFITPTNTKLCGLKSSLLQMIPRLSSSPRYHVANSWPYEDEAIPCSLWTEEKNSGVLILPFCHWANSVFVVVGILSMLLSALPPVLNDLLIFESQCITFNGWYNDHPFTALPCLDILTREKAIILITDRYLKLWFSGEICEN